MILHFEALQLEQYIVLFDQGFRDRDSFRDKYIILNRIGAMVVDIRPSDGTAVYPENVFWGVVGSRSAFGFSCAYPVRVRWKD